MLAAWFRLKYPKITIGALASSAPILFFEEIPPENDFCSIATRDFEHVNGKCADRIRRSWGIIDEFARLPGGLRILSQKFNLCSTPPTTYELKLALVRMYSFAAQYNGRFNHWIDAVCDPIVKASSILEGVAHAMSAMRDDHINGCIILGAPGAAPYHVIDGNSLKAWSWQQCSEIMLIRGCNGYNPILPREFFPNKTQYMEDCLKSYYTLPTLWVQTYYGGEDMIKQGSNIIFSNGLMDLFSSSGILTDLSDTIKAITTKEGSHCLDMNAAEKHDPKWLSKQRKREIKIVERWINVGALETPLPRVINLVFYVI